MFTFRNVLMKQKKKHKQSLESAQYGLEIIFNDREPQNHTLFRGTYLCSPCMGVPTPQRKVYPPTVQMVVRKHS